ncbi:helix-turn-helix domain-containing protein [Bacillus infantis]|uniref:helix-turn-helix domain-containing protein n=1 Tax=Bacillus infantis TaxID=324767 RepID=UPI0020A00D9C|nr:helix-turn-helix domain-containing protein [Bacillus infantis]MCP1161318.1 helix-turn-helix domain-containing protein [Bacillus infantis]
MLKMANIELIRKLHFKEGRSIRQLAKDLNLSRQTIGKHCNKRRFQSINETSQWLIL